MIEKVKISPANPDRCVEGHACNGHELAHSHGSQCGHDPVPHGDHTDYAVGGHLHNAHSGHCDNHGRIETA